MPARTFRFVLGAAILGLFLPALAAAQPDPRQMSGIPLPVNDLPAGTLSVRVIRGSLSNIVVGQEVELSVGGQTRTAKTNEQGRAEFPGLPLGAQVMASTTLDGHRLESRQFAVPDSSGVRMMLVGGASATEPAPSGGATAPPASPAAAAVPGAVTLGDQSRFVFEMGDEALTGFYILQVVNPTTSPVQPAQPIVVPLPKGATQPGPLQGSSPQGIVADNEIRITGPFAPGQTLVQVAFTLPYKGGDVRVEQPLPVDLAQFTTLIEKVGAMTFASPQVTQRREVTAQSDVYIVGQGPGVPAGTPLVFEFGGLPHAPSWPRNVALGLAAVVLLAGLWFALTGRSGGDTTRRQALEQKRERLFAELTALEARQRAAAAPAERDAARRRELVAALERIYAQLDDEAA